MGVKILAKSSIVCISHHFPGIDECFSSAQCYWENKKRLAVSFIVIALSFPYLLLISLPISNLQAAAEDDQEIYENYRHAPLLECGKQQESNL